MTKSSVSAILKSAAGALLMVGAATQAACTSKPAFSRTLASAFEYKGSTDAPVMIKLVSPPADPETGQAPVPSVAIDVESFNGDVSIFVDERRGNEAQVRVTRESQAGYQRDKEAKTSLGDIQYEVKLEPNEAGQVLRIRTSTLNPEGHFQRAHLEIHAPAVDGVIIHTTRGNVIAEGISGRVDISTNEGNVRVMTPQAMKERVTILNRGGNIDYRVRGESTGSLDCEVIRGRVLHKVKHAGLVIYSGTDHTRLRARLNDGRNPVQLRTTDGDIRIAVVPDPMSVGLSIIW